MKKMLLIMAMAALVCWLPGQAMADYTSTLNTVGTHDSTFGVVSNYGTVTVNRLSATYAIVSFTMHEELTADFDFVNGSGNYAAFLNVAGTATVTFPRHRLGLRWVADSRRLGDLQHQRLQW